MFSPDVDLLFVSGQFLRPDLVVIPKEARLGITDRGVDVPLATDDRAAEEAAPDG